MTEPKQDPSDPRVRIYCDMNSHAMGTLIKEAARRGAETARIIYLDGVLSRTYSSSTLNDQDWLTPGGVTSISPYGITEDTEVQACVDVQDAIDEEDETNNCMTVDLEV